MPPVLGIVLRILDSQVQLFLLLIICLQDEVTAK